MRPGSLRCTSLVYPPAKQGDSVSRLVERWASVEPASEAPFREWGFAALARRDRQEARRAYQTGRDRLGRPDALAGEVAP